MQTIDYNVLFLLIIHILETSILLTIFLKSLLGKKTFRKLFFVKVLIFTLLILSLIYTSYVIDNIVLFPLVQSWLTVIVPLFLLVLTFYIYKYFITEKDGFTDYFGDKILFIALFSLAIVYLQVLIFISTGYPTFIVILKILFPLL